MTRVFLEHLGVWEAFQGEPNRTAHASAAAWGDSHPWENHFLYSTHGPGWHVDRVGFDAMLACQSERRGVEVLRDRRAAKVERVNGAWSLCLSDGDEFTARFVVDATGRRAAFARSQGVRLLAFDRLAGFARFFKVRVDPDPRILVETFADGKPVLTAG